MQANESITSVLIFKVGERDFDRLLGEIRDLLARKGSSIPGLMESAWLRDEARTQLWLISRWESRHAWARSRWDQDIGQTITDLVKSAVTYRIEALVPISVMRSRE